MISVQLQTYTEIALVLEEHCQVYTTRVVSIENGMVQHLHYLVHLQFVHSFSFQIIMINFI